MRDTSHPTPRACLRTLGAISVVVVSIAGCWDSPTEPVAEPEPAPTATADLMAAVPVPFTGCTSGTTTTGALFEVCLPEEWNGSLLVWGHGYVSPFEPLSLPDDDVEGVPVSELVNDLGFAYAATSYRDNGLVADLAADDLADLVDAFTQVVGFPPPGFTYVAGGSEGGLATALALERASPRFDGGVVACAPVGSFARQINYFGDARVVFDYFFPGVATILGDPFQIPGDVITNWKTTYADVVRNALLSDPWATEQFLRVTRIPLEDAGDPAAVVETILDVLWYNIHATNDARSKLGGNPFDNGRRWYNGSSNDWRLNLRIRRVRADPAAVAAMNQRFETTGRLAVPTMGLHTTRDPIVPYWHSGLYKLKTIAAGRGGKLLRVPSWEYGHCAFTQSEVVATFAVLVLRVTLRNLVVSADVFPDDGARSEFLELAREHGAEPRIVSKHGHVPVR
jgi:pimeloyl-ACP methyl ester carboxylesterase